MAPVRVRGRERGARGRRPGGQGVLPPVAAVHADAHAGAPVGGAERAAQPAAGVQLRAVRAGGAGAVHAVFVLHPDLGAPRAPLHLERGDLPGDRNHLPGAPRDAAGAQHGDVELDAARVSGHLFGSPAPDPADAHAAARGAAVAHRPGGQPGEAAGAAPAAPVPAGAVPEGGAEEDQVLLLVVRDVLAEPARAALVPVAQGAEHGARRAADGDLPVRGVRRGAGGELQPRRVVRAGEHRVRGGGVDGGRGVGDVHHSGVRHHAAHLQRNAHDGEQAGRARRGAGGLAGTPQPEHDPPRDGADRGDERKTRTPSGKRRVQRLPEPAVRGDLYPGPEGFV
mmetsp:Transcript_6264/g.15524  ORF Transcript_6264/g.15524 Transcript_6264/m.15524 type:complete len:339 (-) Transcript_6264:1762-2778(-)